MSKRKPTTGEIVEWAESGPKKGEKSKRQNPLSDCRLTAWQLRRLGYSVEQVAQVLECSVTTVKRWDKGVRDKFAELPTARIAIDRIQSLIPKALKAYDEALGCEDMRLRKETAKDILSNFKIITDRIEIERDDRNRTDDELIAEAERIIAQAKGSSGRN